MSILNALNTANIDQCKFIYSTLDGFKAEGSQSAAHGVYAAQILGPAWLARLAKASLPLAGLAGWYGKRIELQGAVNLCFRDNEIVGSVPMTRSVEASWFDGRPCLVLAYPKDAPMFLRPMRDEFRFVDEQTLLGLSIYNLPLLKRTPLPFLLRKAQKS